MSGIGSVINDWMKDGGMVEIWIYLPTRISPIRLSKSPNCDVGDIPTTLDLIWRQLSVLCEGQSIRRLEWKGPLDISPSIMVLVDRKEEEPDIWTAIQIK